MLLRVDVFYPGKKCLKMILTYFPGSENLACVREFHPGLRTSMEFNVSMI